MEKTEYTDHNGNVFTADVMLSCPFCGGEAEILFIGNRVSKSRKATIKCTNKMCRCEMVNATLRHDTEWVAKVSIEAWNKRYVK
jgi:hypothetical protein